MSAIRLSPYWNRLSRFCNRQKTGACFLPFIWIWLIVTCITAIFPGAVSITGKLFLWQIRWEQAFAIILPFIQVWLNCIWIWKTIPKPMLISLWQSRQTVCAHLMNDISFAIHEGIIPGEHGGNIYIGQTAGFGPLLSRWCTAAVRGGLRTTVFTLLYGWFVCFIGIVGERSPEGGTIAVPYVWFAFGQSALYLL